MSTIRKLLVPTDFSPHAAAAFRVAHDPAKATWASAVVFHVTRSPAVVPEGDRLPTAPAREAGALTHPVAEQPASRAKS